MKVAFLDRDGVINEEVNYLHKIQDFRYTTDCIGGLKKLKALGFKLIVVTNQAGLAKGFFSEHDFEELTKWLLKDLASKEVELLDYIFCPHHPDGVVKKWAGDCNCRKPRPGMLLAAKRKYSIDMANSILIGDKLSDIIAAKSANVGGVYLVESGHALRESDTLHAPVYSNLFDVAVHLEMQCTLP